MNLALLITLLAAASQGTGERPPDRESRIRAAIEEIVRSGRAVEAGDTTERLKDPRQDIAPGAPPLLSFRYFEGAARHRFGNLDLMMDDAGH